MRKNEEYALYNYKEHYPESEIVTYEELYDSKLKEYIKEFSLLENIEEEQIKKRLALCPSVIQKFLQ